jgi:hypothetical protein
VALEKNRKANDRKRSVHRQTSTDIISSSVTKEKGQFNEKVQSFQQMVLK